MALKQREFKIPPMVTRAESVRRERQYKRRIQGWQFKKNTRAHEIEAVLASSSEGDTTAPILKFELPPPIEMRKIKRYQRRQVLRALRDTSTTLPCPGAPQLKSIRLLICDGSEWMRSYLTIYALERFYDRGVPLIQTGLPVEGLDRPEIPLEQDWLAMFVARVSLTSTPLQTCFQLTQVHSTSHQYGPAP